MVSIETIRNVMRDSGVEKESVKGLGISGQMMGAVMEGVIYALRDIMSGIQNTGVEVDHVHMCGGGSKSPFWRQLLADVYKLSVSLPDMKSENIASIGVAILAAVGCGAYDSVVEACDKIIKMRDDVYTPDAERAAKYDRVYKEFDDLYPKLKDNFKSILSL